jgi:hypothetical protein
LQRKIKQRLYLLPTIIPLQTGKGKPYIFEDEDPREGKPVKGSKLP